MQARARLQDLGPRADARHEPLRDQPGATRRPQGDFSKFEFHFGAKFETSLFLYEIPLVPVGQGLRRQGGGGAARAAAVEQVSLRGFWKVSGVGDEAPPLPWSLIGRKERALAGDWRS